MLLSACAFRGGGKHREQRWKGIREERGTARGFRGLGVFGEGASQIGDVLQKADRDEGRQNETE